jgi:transcriptional regulator with XRE-family HTH domain
MGEKGRQTPGEVLGDGVKVYREARGLSQQGLADRMSRLGFTAWTQNTVSLTERARRSVSVDEHRALAAALGVPPTVLMMARDRDAPEITVGNAVVKAGWFNDWERGELALVLDLDSDEPRLRRLLDQEGPIAMRDQLDDDKLMLRRTQEEE